MTLGSRAFFCEFLSEFEKEKEKWEDIYHKNRIWTGKMLGTGESREKGDFGLLGRLGQRFGYEIAAEWRCIDQVWSYYLPKPEGCDEQPWRNDVLVEHENDDTRLEYAFYRFEEISAPLKVGIFYPGQEHEVEAIEKCRNMILKQVSSYPGGVYLIIFGFLDERKGVCWHAYEIDFKGNVVRLHEQ